jgi:hypothetical protein
MDALQHRLTQYKGSPGQGSTVKSALNVHHTEIKNLIALVGALQAQVAQLEAAWQAEAEEPEPIPVLATQEQRHALQAEALPSPCGGLRRSARGGRRRVAGSRRSALEQAPRWGCPRSSRGATPNRPHTPGVNGGNPRRGASGSCRSLQRHGHAGTPGVSGGNPRGHAC